jgi:hypothetical protein
LGEGEVIREDAAWFTILQSKSPPAVPIAGKWICFGPTPELHLYKDLLNTLVEEGEFLAAKITRKDPLTDPFPHKRCALCVYTTDDKTEIERARTRLVEIGLTPSEWKSELDTRLDWEVDGKLRQEAAIVTAKLRMRTAPTLKPLPSNSTAKVFISHASQELYVATGIAEYLEEHGMACWYASRDVLPGTNYDEAIVEAIEHTQVFAVLVSEASNASRHVKQELELAMNAGASLLPIMINGAAIGKNLRYFLAGKHFLPLLDILDERSLDQIRRSVKGLLDH